jgi:hypothetical protein
MNEQDNEIAQAQVVGTELLEAITRGEIETQIATAHKFPRSIELFNKRAIEMVSMDKETAESCIYSRPVGKDSVTGKQKIVEGESIRLAEIISSAYGNLRVAATLIEQTDRIVRARGAAHDLETNLAATSEVIESTVDKHGQPFSERMRIVVAKAALSKARRDAIFMVVPKALCKKIKNIAKQVAVGDRQTITKAVDDIMKFFKEKGVAEKNIFDYFSVAGKADIGIDELTILIGLKTAINDGEIKPEDAFKTNEVEKNESLESKFEAQAETPSTPTPKPKTETKQPETKGKKGQLF